MSSEVLAGHAPIVLGWLKHQIIRVGYSDIVHDASKATKISKSFGSSTYDTILVCSW